MTVRGCDVVLAAMLMVVELASGGGADGLGLVGLAVRSPSSTTVGLVRGFPFPSTTPWKPKLLHPLPLNL